MYWRTVPAGSLDIRLANVFDGVRRAFEQAFAYFCTHYIQKKREKEDMKR